MKINFLNAKNYRLRCAKNSLHFSFSNVIPFIENVSRVRILKFMFFSLKKNDHITFFLLFSFKHGIHINTSRSWDAVMCANNSYGGTIREAIWPPWHVGRRHFIFYSILFCLLYIFIWTTLSLLQFRSNSPASPVSQASPASPASPAHLDLIGSFSNAEMRNFYARIIHEQYIFIKTGPRSAPFQRPKN